MISVGKSVQAATSKQGRRITSGGSGSGANGLKARQVVTGWPRGRSSSCLGSFDWEYRDYGMMLFGRSYWSFADLGCKSREDELDWKYHQEQQAMLNAYFEQYRTKRPKIQLRVREIA